MTFRIIKPILYKVCSFTNFYSAQLNLRLSIIYICSTKECIHELFHAKTGLVVIVVVVPKEGLAPPQHIQGACSRLQINPKPTPPQPTMFMHAMLCSQFLFRPETFLLCARGVGLQQSIQAADYKSIVSVIPKEGLAWILPAKPSFGMTTTKIF